MAGFSLSIAGAASVYSYTYPTYSFTAAVGGVDVASSLTSVIWYIDGTKAVTATSSSAPAAASPGFPGAQAAGTSVANCQMHLDSNSSFTTVGTFAIVCEVAYNGCLYSATTKIRRMDESSSAPGQLRWPAPAICTRMPTDPALSPSGVIYVGSDNGWLQPINASTGALGTTPTVPNVYPYPPAIARDGRVLCITSGSEAYYFVPSSWTYRNGIGGGMYGPTAIATDGTVYAAQNTPSIFGLTENSSSVHGSQFDIAISPSLSALITTGISIGASGTIYFGCADQRLYAVSPGGAILWSVNLGGATLSTPAIDSAGNIYIGADTPSGSLFKISAAGSVLWDCTFAAWNPTINSSPVIGADETTVYVAGGTASSGFLFAVTTAAGLLKAQNTFSDIHYGSPAVAADGTVYLCMDDGSSGKLYAYRDNGSSLDGQWTYTLPGSALTGSSSPLIGPDGTVYFSGANASTGYVYAVYGSVGPATSGWPMLGKNARRTACASDGQ